MMFQRLKNLWELSKWEPSRTVIQDANGKPVPTVTLKPHQKPVKKLATIIDMNPTNQFKDETTS